ncbi:hypothetical protein DL96DRAFT_1118628 [Flagelloscypha sp. PMI_526]|nr:hypothetical protein DL96DRAFT_1118628 [Flagelloscypha sp. PMI_526]
MEKHFLGIPKLPLEVMGLIFESLAYAEENEEIARTTLRTCALASRTLCTLVQPLLFRSIALDLDLDDDDDDGGFQEEDEGEEDSTPDETSDVHLLLNLFRHSPHLRVHVQEISVGYRSLSSPEFPALLGLLPNVTSFVADGYDEGSSVHSHRGKHFIASVIYCKHHLLPKLTTFKLSSFWQIPDENLDLLQQLRHLEISETDLSPEKGVTGAPTSILKDLHISDRVVPQHPLSHITYGLPAVSFDGCEQGLVKWIKRHNCRPTSLRIFSPNKSMC